MSICKQANELRIMKADNLFELPDLQGLDQELFQDIIRTPGILIERIVSTGQVTPPGEWYDQERDEWVLLLSGNATLSFSNHAVDLKAGDYLLIPAHCKHRVDKTSDDPPCIWLAIHGDLTSAISTTFKQNEN